MGPARFLLVAAISALFTTGIHAQQQAPPQTARQALIEMLTGSQSAAMKHLTVELQQEIKKNPRSAAASGQMSMLGALRSEAGNNLQAFDTGEVLLSQSDPKAHEKWELHIDSDDLAGDEDTLELSIHAFRDGEEIETPMQLISQIAVGMKKQQNVWRLSEITVSAKLPVGDPAFFNKLNDQRTTGIGLVAGGVRASDNATSIRPKMDMEATIGMMAFAEQMYASKHPETGFTCSLAELGKANEQFNSSFGTDPQVFAGAADGYRFALSGCQGVPAGSFQIVAEPIAGGKAFCTDATHNVRVADDGRGSTCLAAGKVPSRNDGNVEFTPQTHTEIKITK